MNGDAQLLLPSDELSHKGQPAKDAKVSEQAAQGMSRSQRNILEWRSFLSEDCVATMIAMGWDVST